MRRGRLLRPRQSRGRSCVSTSLTSEPPNAVSQTSVYALQPASRAAHTQAVGGEHEQLALGADALEHHDSIELEHDRGIDGRRLQPGRSGCDRRRWRGVRRLSAGQPLAAARRARPGAAGQARRSRRQRRAGAVRVTPLTRGRDPARAEPGLNATPRVLRDVRDLGSVRRVPHRPSRHPPALRGPGTA